MWCSWSMGGSQPRFGTVACGALRAARTVRCSCGGGRVVDYAEGGGGE